MWSFHSIICRRVHYKGRSLFSRLSSSRFFFIIFRDLTVCILKHSIGSRIKAYSNFILKCRLYAWNSFRPHSLLYWGIHRVWHSIPLCWNWNVSRLLKLSWWLSYRYWRNSILILCFLIKFSRSSDHLLHKAQSDNVFSLSRHSCRSSNFRFRDIRFKGQWEL